MTDVERSQRAFVLRIAPGGSNRVPVALASNQLIIGWAKADLTDRALTWADYVSRFKAAYGPDVSNQQAGAWTGIMMHFTRGMEPGDLVVVPHGSGFHVAEVSGPLSYDASLIDDDTAYRRPCRWLNDKKPIPRVEASAGLQWRLKARQTCVDATDLLGDILRVIEDAGTGHRRDFRGDLREAALASLRSSSSHMNDWEFERLVANVFTRLGASRVEITPRRLDKGDDVVANFENLGLTIVAQAKYHPDPRWKTGEGSLDQLLAGMAARDADIGWLVTCGEFGFDVAERERVLSEEGKRVRFVDGVQLAGLLVDVGAGSHG